MQLEADGAGIDLFDAARPGSADVALSEKAQVHRKCVGRLTACEWICHGPGEQVVAEVPVAGPVPPPIMVVTPLTSALPRSAAGR
jgi:hypothetical protein